jgi:phosphoglucosamine mutase
LKAGFFGEAGDVLFMVLCCVARAPRRADWWRSPSSARQRPSSRRSPSQSWSSGIAWIVATVMSNLGFERAWQAAGGVLERTAVGDQYVHAAMEELGAALGGEQSGHILSARHGMSGDGLLTALQVAVLIQRRGGTLADWMDSSFRPYPQKLVNITVPDRQRRTQWQQCEPLRRAVERAEAAMAGQGRVLVRASGTEPLLRVMVEAAEAEQVEHWANLLATEADRQLNAV